MMRTALAFPTGIVFVAVVFLLISLFPANLSSTDLSFKLMLNKGAVAISGEREAVEISVREKGYSALAQPGAPDLPVRYLSVVIPQGQSVAGYSFTSERHTVIARDVQIQPAGAAVAEDGTVAAGKMLFDPESATSVFPGEFGIYLGSNYYHGYTLATFVVAPLQYGDGTVTLHEELTLTIRTEPETRDGAAIVRQRLTDGFDETVRSVLARAVLNPDAIGGYQFDRVAVAHDGGFQPSDAPSLEGSPIEYLIITSDALAAEYQRLADWKTAKGVPAVVRTIEWIEANYRNGVDLPETIRFFIQDAYAKWGVSWVLLGGDTDVIPARFAVSRFYDNGKVTLVPTDLYFACLDGSWNSNHNEYFGEGFYYVLLDSPDVFPEVYLGRLPTSTPAAVSDIVDKIMSYATPNDPAYQENAMMLGEVLFPDDWVPGEIITLNGAEISEGVYTDSFQGSALDVTRSYETYDLYPGSIAESRDATIDSMNAGMNIINHIGHGFRFTLSLGDGSMLNADADALTNLDRYFLLYMLNCKSTAFDYDCLAERFLLNPAGGAVSIVGACRNAYPNASTPYMTEFYDLLLNQGVVHIGETFTRSRLPRSPAAGAGDNIDLWTHYIYAMLSDPELAIWTAAVETLEVAHPANIGMGETAVTVTVTNGGVPVDSAFVCLYKGEDDYQYAATDALGQVSFDFTCEEPGSVSVVVTGRNYARSQSYITVGQSAAAYVNYDDCSIDDDGTGGSFGNGDGVIDAGETVDVLLTLINTGAIASDSVWCVLSTTDPDVTVLDDTAAFGAIGSQGTLQALDPVRLQFASSISDESPVEFTLAIHTTGTTWNDSFKKLVHAPVLKLITLRIDDSVYGNGNGIQEAGEQVQLFCTIKNYGTGSASGLTVGLMDLNHSFTFFDSTDTFAELAHMDAGENLTGFHLLEESVTLEHYIEMTITDMFGHVHIDTLELRIPDPPSFLLFDASFGVDRIEITWTASISPDVASYYVYHSLTEGGPYDLVSDDPVDHSVYMDTGLTPSTRYYYVITAIDESGNESAPSIEYSTSTNPPQLIGWPIEMEDWTASSPAFGDIDGDGDLEIVQGNKQVYAWHHNAIEVIDGDANPQSWGVLNLHGSDFVAPIALAKLDDVPGLDIVAISWATYEVFCFNYQGDILPGWPKTTATNVRTAPVIADLDGDNNFEIVVVDQTAVIYAWHADGTEYRDGDSNGSTDGVFYQLPAPGGWHYQAPAVCDIDHDGMDELVVGSVIDSIWVFNEDGSQVAGWPVAINGTLAGSIPVGDVDLDGEFEILVAAKGSSEVKLFNHDGTLCSGWPRWITSNLTYNPSVALADVAGDAHLEVIMASSNKRIYLVDYLGADLPGWPLYYSNDTYTESSPVIADITGDGAPDIILGDEAKYLNAWDSSGTPLDGFPIAVTDAVRGTPAVTDIDGDGDIELICAAWDKNLYIWELDGAYDPAATPWPTFHANSHRNGQVGYDVPTAIQNVAFSYQLTGTSLELSWIFPLAGGYLFDLYRSDTGGGFIRVESGLAPDESGRVRYIDDGLTPGGRYSYRLEAVTSGNDHLETGEIYVPIASAGLDQNYPNPFNPTTTIVFYVPDGAAQRVSLKVYDVNGALVKTLVNGVLAPSRYEFEWNGRNDAGDVVGSGVYFYQLREQGFSATKKMVLLK